MLFFTFTPLLLCTIAHMSTLWGSNRETCRNDCSTGLGTLWGTLVSVGCAEEVFLCSTPPPSPPEKVVWAATTP